MGKENTDNWIKRDTRMKKKKKNYIQRNSKMKTDSTMEGGWLFKNKMFSQTRFYKVIKQHI